MGGGERAGEGRLNHYWQLSGELGAIGAVVTCQCAVVCVRCFEVQPTPRAHNMPHQTGGKWVEEVFMILGALYPLHAADDRCISEGRSEDGIIRDGAESGACGVEPVAQI